MLAQANALRIPLRDRSVHCAITSVPYWALRDYGTAAWAGGDPQCQHAPVTLAPGRDENHQKLPGSHATNGGQLLYAAPRHTCETCGAMRYDQQIGLERVPDCGHSTTRRRCGVCYLCHIVDVFGEVWRVLRDDGSLWLNIGDTYSAKARGTDAGLDKSTLRGRANSAMASAREIQKTPSATGLPRKNLIGIPWRIAFALQRDGWILRAAPPWLKRNSMPDSATDRPTTGYEFVFLFVKSRRYFYDRAAVVQPVTGTANARGSGVNPKARRAASGWDTGPGSHDKLTGRYAQQSRQNPSFSTAVTETVDARSRRVTDWWFESLDTLIEQQRAYLGRLERVRAEGGLLVDEDGEPLAFAVNAQGFRGSHFATFPEALVEPCLLASTSTAGVCPECGAQWVREVESEALVPWHERKARGATTGSKARGYNENHGQGMSHTLGLKVTTTGWCPSCECDAGAAVPATVLDPFAGSCTVGKVARLHGRKSVMLDYSLDYLREHGLARANGATHAGALDGLPLFAELQEQQP